MLPEKVVCGLFWSSASFLSEFQQEHFVREISRCVAVLLYIKIIFSESNVIDRSVKSIGRAHGAAKSAVRSGQLGKE